MTKAQLAERDEYRAKLRAILPPGSTVYTVLRHVSRSGMSRLIDCYIPEQAERGLDISRLTFWIAKATGLPYDRKAEAIRIGGCGMDMGFAIVYDLAYSLYGDGFGCIGERCPSNDHSNGDRDFTPHDRGTGDGHVHWHTSGGYALRHRWM